MMSTRRIFLKATSGAALGLYLSPLGCEQNSVVPKIDGARFSFLTPVDPSTRRDGRPADSHFVQFGAEGSVPNWSYEGVDVVSRSDWRLELTGLFDQPRTISFSDLEAAETDGGSQTVVNTLRCIVDSTSIPGLVGTALWRGVPLRRFLDEAGVDPAVRRFRIFGRDGFTNNLRREDVFVPSDEPERSVLLAYAMNGDDVPHIHGGPVRLLVPGRYGFKSLKWAERIEATTDDTVFGTYQEQLGFFDDGTIQLATKVTNPLAAATIAPGPFELFGYAVSGAAAVGSVEVSIDDGPFETATLEPFEALLEEAPDLADTLQVELGRQYPFRGVWTLFRFPWQAEPGSHRLRFRAVDALGEVQKEVDSDPTNGSDAYWDIRVQVS